MPLAVVGPDIQALLAKSPMESAVARQHRASVRATPQPNLVDWGVGPDRDEQLARVLMHPFARPPAIEFDMRFAIRA